jgi:hypothetical protein
VCRERDSLCLVTRMQRHVPVRLLLSGFKGHSRAPHAGGTPAAGGGLSAVCIYELSRVLALQVSALYAVIKLRGAARLQF